MEAGSCVVAGTIRYEEGTQDVIAIILTYCYWLIFLLASSVVGLHWTSENGMLRWRKPINKRIECADQWWNGENGGFSFKLVFTSIFIPFAYDKLYLNNILSAIQCWANGTYTKRQQNVHVCSAHSVMHARNTPTHFHSQYLTQSRFINLLNSVQCV